MSKFRVVFERARLEDAGGCPSVDSFSDRAARITEEGDMRWLVKPIEVVGLFLALLCTVIEPESSGSVDTSRRSELRLTRRLTRLEVVHL